MKQAFVKEMKKEARASPQTARLRSDSREEIKIIKIPRVEIPPVLELPLPPDLIGKRHQRRGVLFSSFFFFLSNKLYISICTVSVVRNAIHMYYCNYTQNYNARTGITIPVWDPIIVWGK